LLSGSRHVEEPSAFIYKRTPNASFARFGAISGWSGLVRIWAQNVVRDVSTVSLLLIPLAHAVLWLTAFCGGVVSVDDPIVSGVRTVSPYLRIL